jgi:hypothetical protein
MASIKALHDAMVKAQEEDDQFQRRGQELNPDSSIFRGVDTARYLGINHGEGGTFICIGGVHPERDLEKLFNDHWYACLPEGWRAPEWEKDHDLDVWQRFGDMVMARVYEEE